MTRARGDARARKAAERREPVAAPRVKQYWKMDRSWEVV